MFKTFRTSRQSAILCLTIALAFSPTIIVAQQRTQPATAPAAKEFELLKPLQYRSIGPYRGGRSAAVTGVASQPFVYYYGATGGGVWKTTDGGINWESVS